MKVFEISVSEEDVEAIKLSEKVLMKCGSDTIKLVKEDDNWIPVSDILPSEGQEAWITTKPENVRKGMFTKHFGAAMKEGFICSEGLVETNDVSAWQPYNVPAPYQPDSH
ncbi:hypothetical protein LKD70_16385 [Ruminococcus sp. CLA-AA-H200]|uniref:DUF551 domain-containing protein n=1 Tax=Ruminococcus turbiniformis TaxID=2881258 RepID=A0ABS8G145_9FIRM|nr:hypothetical protein [Ruminococcus turbiniformis]MCC2255971.1 hypothetical protein [Ruminococcus turbiniformis]